MSEPAARVISLLPAAGKLDLLVGVSHECDYPEEVGRKRRGIGPQGIKK